MSINKVSLAHSHPHPFAEALCVLPLYDGRLCIGDQMAPKAEITYFLAYAPEVC